MVKGDELIGRTLLFEDGDELGALGNDEPEVRGLGGPPARRPTGPPTRRPWPTSQPTGRPPLQPRVDSDPDTPVFGEQSEPFPAPRRKFQATLSPLASPRRSSADKTFREQSEPFTSPRRQFQAALSPLASPIGPSADKAGANKMSNSPRWRSVPDAPPAAVRTSSPPSSPGLAGAGVEDVRVAVREEMCLLLQVNREQIAQQHEGQLRALEQRLRGGQASVPEMDAVLLAQPSPAPATASGQERAAAGGDDAGRRSASPGSLCSTVNPFAHHAEEHKVGMEVFSDWVKYSTTEAELFAGEAKDVSEAVVRRVQDAHNYFEENYGYLPDPTSRFAKAMRSKRFELLSGFIILINTGYLLYDADVTITKAIQGDSFNQVHAGDVLFLSWFTIELILKLVAQGKYFFTAQPDVMWNYFDALLWFMAFLLLLFSATGVKVSFLRILRCLKLVRIVHMLHFLEFTRELRTMMESTIQSALTLIWCLLMVSFFVLLFALFCVQSCSVALLRTDADSELTDTQRSDVIAYFGSVQQAVLSLVMVTTGGFDWEVLYNTLVPVGTHAVAGICFFIFFFQIAVWNVVTSIFVDKALQLAKPDAEKALFEKRKAEFRDRRVLRKMMEKCSASGSGTMRRDEFIRLMAQSDFQSFLQDRGIEIKEAVTFFSMVAAAIGTDEVSLDALALSCLRIRGFATGIDLNVLRYETRIHLNGIKSSVTELRRTVEGLAVAVSRGGSGADGTDFTDTAREARVPVIGLGTRF